MNMLLTTLLTQLKSSKGRTLVAAIPLALLLVVGSGALFLKKDTALDAFVPANHPVLDIRDRVQDEFGLRDPVVVVVDTKKANGIFDSEAMAYIRLVSQAMQNAPGVAPGVISLTTQQSVKTEGYDILVHPLLRDLPDEEAAEELKAGLDRSSFYYGMLASDDSSVAMFVAEPLPNFADADVYLSIRKSIEALKRPANIDVHYAGQAVVAGFLSMYVDMDVMKLVPLAIALVLILLALTMKSITPVLSSLIVIAGSVGIAMGAMGWVGSPIYVITSGLPLVLICISVADMIHLYNHAAFDASKEGVWKEEHILHAIEAMWKPMFLTTVSTVAGFACMAIGSSLPPLSSYGAFAAVGVASAWMMTVTVLPVFLLKRMPGKPVSQEASIDTKRGRAYSLWMKAFAFSWNKPGLTLSIATGFVAICGLLATQVEFNYKQASNFGKNSEIRIADDLMNSMLDGTQFVDVVVQAPEGETLLEPKTREVLVELSTWMQEQGGFTKAWSFLSIMDWLENATRMEGEEAIEVSADHAEQLLFFYTSSGSVDDLKEEITTDRTKALIRGYARTDQYDISAPQLASLNIKLKELLTPAGIKYELGGTMPMTNSAVEPVLSDLISGFGLAFLAVFACAFIGFRKASDSFVCMMPTLLSVAAVFAVMGVSGMWLDVTTSMFAAISLGLGVDFAIHALCALKRLPEDQPLTAEDAGNALWSTARGLSVNGIALIVGFMTLMLSAIPPINNYGALIATAIGSSFVTGMILTPAFYLVFIRTKKPLDVALPINQES